MWKFWNSNRPTQKCVTWAEHAPCKPIRFGSVGIRGHVKHFEIFVRFFRQFLGDFWSRICRLVFGAAGTAGSTSDQERTEKFTIMSEYISQIFPDGAFDLFSATFNQKLNLTKCFCWVKLTTDQFGLRGVWSVSFPTRFLHKSSALNIWLTKVSVITNKPSIIQPSYNNK